MKIQYKHYAPNQQTRITLNRANEIIEDYHARGFGLTLRQLYYQLVARDLIPNTQEAYNRIGRIITHAREAGLVDWDAIIDRTRSRRGLESWDSPRQAADQLMSNYRIDKWENQSHKVFVWVEKEALAGVIEKACLVNKYQVSFLSCRGYISASTIHDEAQTIKYYYHQENQTPVILHLADHDPSGIDMTRDNITRLALYSGLTMGEEFIYKRIALNRDQIEQYNPPPNPAKTTDSRYKKYIRDHGYDSWELDALDPDVLIELIHKHINNYRDQDLWDKLIRKEKRHIKKLSSWVEVL